MAPFTLTDTRVIGPFLVLLMYFPRRIKKLLPPKLQLLLKSPLLIKLLSVIAGYHILRKTNSAISQYCSNNGRSIVFRTSDELVLISGGSSGIGLLMAKEFAKRGVKVIILDLREPRDLIRKLFHRKIREDQNRPNTYADSKLQTFTFTNVILRLQMKLQRQRPQFEKTMVIQLYLLIMPVSQP